MFIFESLVIGRNGNLFLLLVVVVVVVVVNMLRKFII